MKTKKNEQGVALKLPQTDPRQTQFAETEKSLQKMVSNFEEGVQSPDLTKAIEAQAAKSKPRTPKKSVEEVQAAKIGRLKVPGMDQNQPELYDTAEQIEHLKESMRMRSDPHSQEYVNALLDYQNARLEGDEPAKMTALLAIKRIQSKEAKAKLDEARKAHDRSLSPEDVGDLEIPAMGFGAYISDESDGLDGHEDFEPCDALTDEQTSPAALGVIQAINSMSGSSESQPEGKDLGLLTEVTQSSTNAGALTPGGESQGIAQGASQGQADECNGGDTATGKDVNYKDKERLARIEQATDKYIAANTISFEEQDLMMKDALNKKFAVAMITRGLLDYLQTRDKELSLDAEEWFLSLDESNPAAYTRLTLVLEGMPSRGVDLLDAVDERPMEVLNGLLRAFKELDSSRNAHTRSNEFVPLSMELQSHKRASW